jgi:hypothetical protein
MKKIVLSIFVAAAFIAPVAAQKKASTAKPKAPAAKPQAPVEKPAFTSLALGSPIPNEGAMLPGKPGEMVSLMQAKTDKGLVVMFSCNTCPYVIKGQKRTMEAMAISKRLGIGMVIINSNEAQRDNEDSQPAMNVYATEQNYIVPYLRDEQSMMANQFGATRTPEVFLFDGSGKLVYKGAMEDNPATPQESSEFYLNDAMNALAENRPIKKPETKSIGCSIKRQTL